MKKLKICFYCDTIFSFGGVQRVLAVIAGELSKEHDVTILTHDSPQEADTSMYDLNHTNICFDYIAYANFPFYEYLPCKTYSLLYKKILPQNKLTSHIYGYSSFPFSRRRKLIKRLNDGGFDIVVGVHAFLSLYLASISHKLKAKTIGWMHNSYNAFFETKNLFLWNQKKQFRYEIPKLNSIIVLSRQDQFLYKKELNINARQIYNPLTLAPKGKGEYNYKKFLAVGRFSYLAKGFDILIEAFSIFSKENKEWNLEIVGEGPEESQLKSLIKRHDLEERIKIRPFTKNIQYHYANASVFILSSRWEGFGLVLVEAMAHKLPIIASNLPVVEEIIGSTENHLFFKNEDINDLSCKMADIIKRNDFKRMGEESIQRAKYFDLKRIIHEWNILLENIIK